MHFECVISDLKRHQLGGRRVKVREGSDGRVSKEPITKMLLRNELEYFSQLKIPSLLIFRYLNLFL